MRYLILLALAGLLSLLSAGCATVVRGDEQGIKFNTDPQGAKVVIDNKEALTTPGEAKLKRKEAHTILITKDGYQPVTFEMKAQWDGMALGNIVMPGGSIGTATDRVSGSDLAFYTLPTIKLTPLANGSASAEPIKMYQFKGGLLLNQKDYDAAVAQEKREEFLHRE